MPRCPVSVYVHPVGPDHAVAGDALARIAAQRLRFRNPEPDIGVKPDLVIKGGVIAAAPMGDPNASIPTPEPVVYRPMFGAFGRAPAATSLHFVARAALEAGTLPTLGRPCVAVAGTRSVRKGDMIHNYATPAIEVDPDSYEVRIDGERVDSPPAAELPLAQRYFLF